MQIQIDIEALKSVLSVDDKGAGLMIDDTDKARINEYALIELNGKNDGYTFKRVDRRITMETPDELDDGLLVIDLINKHGGIITTPAYDLKTKQFRQEQEEEEEVAPRCVESAAALREKSQNEQALSPIPQVCPNYKPVYRRFPV
jgi:hypothetical protein